MLTYFTDGEVPYEVSVRAFIFTCYGDSGVSSPFFSRVGSKSSIVYILPLGTNSVSYQLLC